MPALSPAVVKEFCTLCDRAHEFWLNHLELFDNNPRNEILLNSVINAEWVRLSIISQEYSLLQVIKLHDPAVMRRQKTLGINYVLEYGDWPISMLERLKELATELGGFAEKLRGARNKILSHNDLDTILTEATLGAFDSGEDKKYFSELQEFINIVHGEVIGGPFQFHTQVIEDIAYFVRSIRPDDMIRTNE